MCTHSGTTLFVLLLFFFASNESHSEFTNSNSTRATDSTTNAIRIQPVHQNVTRECAGSNSTSLAYKWSKWSKCKSCTQTRYKYAMIPPINDLHVSDYQQKPCPRQYCRRLWHKKRAMRKLHRRKAAKKSKRKPLTTKYMGGYVEYDRGRRYRKKISRTWSKWSSWTKCNATCKTHRYKVCKKPGRCLKAKKYETRLCYTPDTHCEVYYKNVLHYLNISQLDTLGIASTTTTTTTTLAPKPRINSRRPKTHYLEKQYCGRPLRKQFALFKIKGGRDAERGRWPWNVAIVNERNEVFCSGTLIASRWVLTAGHCVQNNLKVRVNEYDLRYQDGEIEIPILWSHRHQNFSVKNIDNDIGLLYMQHGVKNPVACLPTQAPTVEDKCTILGWGSVGSGWDIGHPILQEAKVPIVHNPTCKAAYAQYYISQNMFCAGYKSGDIDTCSGDSGSGLLCKSLKNGDNRKYYAYTVQGITSFGEGCGKRHRYGIYTKVVNYLSWIKRTMDEYLKSKSKSKHRDFHAALTAYYRNS